MFKPYFYKITLADKLKALKGTEKLKSEDYYINELKIADMDYLNTVNSFWHHWSGNRTVLYLPFLEYLSNTSRKDRLVYSPVDNHWHLLYDTTRADE